MHLQSQDSGTYFVTNPDGNVPRCLKATGNSVFTEGRHSGNSLSNIRHRGRQNWYYYASIPRESVAVNVLGRFAVPRIRMGVQRIATILKPFEPLLETVRQISPRVALPLLLRRNAIVYCLAELSTALL